MSDKPKAPSPRTRVKRANNRAVYDRAAIDAILDAGMICHVGFVYDGYPVVTPTIYWREGDHVYWHGSSASRMLRAAEGADVCLTVTHLDGLVLARSAFHHSANYRSVMLFGKASKVEDDAVHTAHLKTFVDGIYPGRWDTLRPMNAQELKATTTLSMPINEVSAKIRATGPIDDEADMDVAVWAGVVPLTLRGGAAEPDAKTQEGSLAVPAIHARMGFQG